LVTELSSGLSAGPLRMDSEQENVSAQQMAAAMEIMVIFFI